MSSSCLSGAGRTYLLDLEILKSPSTSSSIRTPHSSSPSSTLSESSDSPITISTRKPRTTRKRPNQTYSEAAALLSTACPNVFSPKHFTGAGKFPIPLAEPSELLPPFPAIEDSDCLIHLPIIEQPAFRIERRVSDFFESPVQSKLQDPGSSPGDRFAEEDDFDAESILDEETSDGIDSIMGNPGVENSSVDGGEINARSVDGRFDHGGFGFGFGFGTRAFKGADQGGNPWMFPAVDILQISPRLSKAPAPKKKKKIGTPPASKRESPGGDQQVKLEIPDSPKPESNPTLLLKLNHDEVLKVWSDRASPFSDGISGADGSAKLAEIDLFPAENGGGVGGGGGVREASVLRYKEKRRTRYFSKKIRYQVRKVNADRRPRMKGRFVRRLGNASAAHK